MISSFHKLNFCKKNSR